MSTYIVEGRRFNRRLHAVTFAQTLACEYGRSIEVKVEVKDFFGRFQRSWMCRMHPEGVQRTILNPAPAEQSRVCAV